MQRFFSALKNNKLLAHNIILFVGALAVGGLNYLYYPVIGRMLPPATFGEVQTLVSLFLQLYVVFGVLSLLTVTLVTNNDNEVRRNKIIIELERLSLFVSLVLLVVVWLASGILQEFLHFTSGLPFVVLALIVAITVPFTFRSSYLRGHKLFGLSSWSLILGAGSKLGFSVVLVAAGFGTTGAILGIALAQLVSFWFAAWQAKRHGFSESLRSSFFAKPDLSLIRPELAYAGLVFVCTLVMTLLYSADIVIVKRLFEAHTAGLYGGIAAVARIPFFLTASIPQVLMSSVKMTHSEEKNRKILRQSSVMMFVMGGASTAFFWLFPDWTVGLLMGQVYLPYAHLLPHLSLAVFIVSAVNLYVTYYLALRRWSIGLVAVGGAIATVGFLMWQHASPDEVVASLLSGSIITAGILGLFMAYDMLIGKKNVTGEMGKGAKA